MDEFKSHAPHGLGASPDSTVVAVVMPDADAARRLLHQVASHLPAAELQDKAGVVDPDLALPIGDVGVCLQSHPPASPLVSLLAEKGCRPVTPVLPDGVQWVQAGRRYAAYRGNSLLGGIDPIASVDPGRPEWVAWASNSRNELIFTSLREAMEWVMTQSANPVLLVFDVLQEHVGPINLRLAPDGYRFAIRLKGTDNLLCLHLFDERHATSQEMRFNFGLVPTPQVDAIAWLDKMVAGLRAGLQLYRDWSHVPGREVSDEEFRRSHVRTFQYIPPVPEQLVDAAALRESPALTSADLDMAADAGAAIEDSSSGGGDAAAGAITFTPRGEWAVNGDGGDEDGGDEDEDCDFGG